MAQPSSLRRPATLENLASFLDLVQRWAESERLPGETTADLRLIAEEACTNVVMHGFRDRPPGELALELHRHGDEVQMLLEDDGQAFDPATAPPADLEADWQTRRVGGLGWHLIRSLADGIGYERVDDRNRLALRMRVVRP